MEEKLIRCVMCSDVACISIGTTKICLLHYCTSEYILDIKKFNPVIQSQPHLLLQSSTMEQTWKKITVELLTDMYNAQKDEEEEYRKDPFASLAASSIPVNPPIIDSSAVSKKRNKESNQSNFEVNRRSESSRKANSNTIVVKSQQNIQTCERCESSNVHIDFNTLNDCNRSEIWGSKSVEYYDTYRCKACGHSWTL